MSEQVVTVPMDHSFCIELADVGTAAIEMLRDVLTVAGFLDRETGLPTGGRTMVMASVIVFVPVASL